MDALLVILGIIALIVGFLGSFLPILPGPPVAWLSLLLLHFTSHTDFSIQFLVITAVVTLLIVFMNYVLPIKLTKKFGGTKMGERGALLGTIVGLFFGPIGIILGPLLGAFAGEIIVAPTDIKKALKVGLGSFAGFLLSTGLSMIWCLMIAWWFGKALIYS